MNVEVEKKNVKHILSVARREYAKMPAGSLRISSSKNGNIQYYHYISENGKVQLDEYISKKKNMKLIKKLAQKKYLESIIKAGEKNLNYLEAEVPENKYTNLDELYENLQEPRKSLITPVNSICDERAKEWASETFIPNPYHPEQRTFKTDRGEYVRSKSERMIANWLFKNEKYVFYKYEAPLKLPNNKILYPDFTIMRRKDARIFYLEHAGMLDSPEYSEGFVGKINLYNEDGIYNGINLLLTFETNQTPLNLPILEKSIQSILIDPILE